MKPSSVVSRISRIEKPSTPKMYCTPTEGIHSALAANWKSECILGSLETDEEHDQQNGRSEDHHHCVSLSDPELQPPEGDAGHVVQLGDEVDRPVDHAEVEDA